MHNQIDGAGVEHILFLFFLTELFLLFLFELFVLVARVRRLITFLSTCGVAFSFWRVMRMCVCVLRVQLSNNVIQHKCARNIRHTDTHLRIG